MKIHHYTVLLLGLYLAACSSQKTIYNNNTFYQTTSVDGGAGRTYQKNKITTTKKIKAEIIEKTDYVIIKTSDTNDLNTTVLQSNIAEISPQDLELLNTYHFPKKDVNESLKYFDIKFGLQALTIPLKFRRSVGDDLLNPPTIETGVNVGFAPGWKFTHNVYKPSKNYLGKNTNQYAIAIGPHFGLGTTDLKKASNAPGILSDRKAATFTYGSYILIGFNNINLGFAVGADKVIGQRNADWVYQNKLWKGVILSLDILKF